MKKKINIKFGNLPESFPEGHIIKNIDDWQIDTVNPVAATILDTIPNNYLDHIYVSHILEYIPHPELYDVFKTLLDKLRPGGFLTIDILDFEWVAKEVLKFEGGQLLIGSYSDYEGKIGLQSLIYGTYQYEWDRHQSSFTRRSLFEWLDGMGFKNIRIQNILSKDNTGLLFATCRKVKEDE